MASEPIPVIQVSGTHRQVGQQIGEQLKTQIQTMRSNLKSSLTQGITWQDMLQQSSVYLVYSQVVYPQYIEELRGIAEGAQVPFEELFLGMCEELWEKAAWKGKAVRNHTGCTDFAARGRATLDGHTLLAHTNDLSLETERDLVILRVQAGDEPEFLGVSVGGVGFSAGYNAAGISLTGNQVDNNDIRPGVPRLLVVRAILAAQRLGQAMDACLLPQRASSYNNILADQYGEVYSMEGSATDCEPLYIDGDILAHANHYISAPMRKFEADRSEIGDSVIRYNRAMRLLKENYGQLSTQLIIELLADHANYPASICKHLGEAVTVFSMIIDLNDLKAWIGRGRPCETTYHEHQLSPWSPPDRLK